MEAAAAYCQKDTVQCAFAVWKLTCSQVKRCVACIIPVVDCNASLDQRLQHMCLPKGSCIMQWCAAILHRQAEGYQVRHIAVYQKAYSVGGMRNTSVSFAEWPIYWG